jgi:hypothetical protein
MTKIIQNPAKKVATAKVESLALTTKGKEENFISRNSEKGRKVDMKLFTG